MWPCLRASCRGVHKSPARLGRAGKCRGDGVSDTARCYFRDASLNVLRLSRATCDRRDTPLRALVPAPRSAATVQLPAANKVTQVEGHAGIVGTVGGRGAP